MENKDLIIDVTTDETGFFETILPKMNCKLKVLILSSQDIFNLGIYLNTLRDITLFEVADYSLIGNYYIPLKVIPRAYNNEIYNFDSVYWELNDELLVQVQSKPNTNIKIILRYE